MNTPPLSPLLPTHKELRAADRAQEDAVPASASPFALLPTLLPAPPKPAPAKISRQRRSLQWSTAGCTAMGLALGLIAPLALPAYGAVPVTQETTAHVVESPLLKPQSLKVAATAEQPALARDGYGATTVEELATMRAAAEAAAQAQRDAEAAAAAAAAAEAAAATRAATPSGSSAKTFQNFTATPPPTTAYSGDALVAYAEQFVGNVPYGYGNDPSDSFSCDGLTQYVFGQFGISLPRMVSNQAARGVQVSAADAQAGDLIVWPGQHIGIYDGAGGVIHSPDFGRMVTHAHNLWGSYYFVRIAG